jgi:hypothetical protein
MPNFPQRGDRPTRERALAQMSTLSEFNRTLRGDVKQQKEHL